MVALLRPVPSAACLTVVVIFPDGLTTSPSYCNIKYRYTDCDPADRLFHAYDCIITLDTWACFMSADPPFHHAGFLFFLLKSASLSAPKTKGAVHRSVGSPLPDLQQNACTSPPIRCMIRARGSVWIDKQNAFQPRATAIALGFTYSSGNIISHDSYTIKRFLSISIHTPPRIYIALT